MENRVTPLKAIRLKCLDCMCGSTSEVKRCNIPGCSLYVYRFGKNPARRGCGPKNNTLFCEKTLTQLRF
jgi:hypothetical protein